jgi:heptaprenylglyceryl phosphate synthase
VLSHAPMDISEKMKTTHVTFVMLLVLLALELLLKNVPAAMDYTILTDNVSITAQLDISETAIHGIVTNVDPTALLVIAVEAQSTNVVLVMKEDTYMVMNVLLSAQPDITKKNPITPVKHVTLPVPLVKTLMNVLLALKDFT